MSYSIRYLEQISGIKAHTIRIWEKRYGLFTPERTDTNIRTYGNDELKKLLNIKVLLDAGYKISEISRLSDTEMDDTLAGLLDKPSSDLSPQLIYVSNLVAAALDFDLAAFEKIFNTSVLKFGFSETVENILYPLLNKVGILWQQNKIHPAQEHFISNLARQKLFTAIDGVVAGKSSRKEFILFLPEFEDHEIGLLYSYYLLVKSGIPATYLGQRVPFKSLKSSVKIIDPTHLFLFVITRRSNAQLNKYFQELADAFPNQEILISGDLQWLQKQRLPAKIKLVENPDHFKKMLQLKA